MIVIADTGPLLALAKVQALDLLKGLYQQVILGARQTAQKNFAAAGVATDVKGTLGIIVSAAQASVITAQQAIAIIESLKHRPDIWLSPVLCDAVIETLKGL